jgi:MFS family permease
MTAYARFVAASGVTNLADGIAALAWVWAATLLTRDPFLVAFVGIALRLPWAILASPAGVVTDRVDRRRLILAMDVLRGLAFAAAALVLAAASRLPPAVGGAEVFRDNAAQTMLPALAPREAPERANGRMWSVELVGNALLGPALGAFLIGAAAALPFSVNAGLCGLAVLPVAGVAGTFRTRPRPATWGPRWPRARASCGRCRMCRRTRALRRRPVA